jgi:uncharacterized protein YggT (Ycf19 family)
MTFIDFILNLAGLLLWMKWRSLPFDPINRRIPATLVGTLRRAAPSRFRRWHLLVAIGALLILRALFYWQIGSASTPAWVEKLNLGATVLPFVSNSFGRMLLFSAFSFGLALGVVYVCLLLLSILAGRAANAEPVHRLVRMQLGVIDDWPRWIKFLLPLAVAALVWGLASWPFAWLHPSQTMSASHRIEESLVIGLGSYLAWKFAAAGLLALHLLNTYIYFGRHPFWNYVNAAAQTLLSPLRKIPLRAGKVDFAPVIGIAIVFFAGELAERGLVLLYARLPF